MADLTASAVSADLQHKEELSLQEELVSKLKNKNKVFVARMTVARAIADTWSAHRTL